MHSRTDILREAASTGFQPEPFEKAVRLLETLETLVSHPFLKGRIALKGGTALNLFVFDMPRLSIDIDLNYIGAADRQTMLADKPKVDQAVHAVCGRLGLQIKRIPTEHAGGKWRLSWTSVTGRPGTLELDLNFLLRTTLWPVELKDSQPLGSFRVLNIPVLDIHELSAGKLAALFGRAAGRDLFDTRRLLSQPELDMQRLRIGFVVYGGANRRDWRGIALEDIEADPVELERQLFPMLRGDLVPARESLCQWSDSLVADCRRLLAPLLPLTPAETEFLTLLNDNGIIAPHLLTGDPVLQQIILTHPALNWKAQNVRDHKSGDAG
jgi:predicted nucleotidyltransferase component of viral defense system